MVYDLEEPMVQTDLEDLGHSIRIYDGKPQYGGRGASAHQRINWRGASAHQVMAHQLIDAQGWRLHNDVTMMGLLPCIAGNVVRREKRMKNCDNNPLESNSNQISCQDVRCSACSTSF